MPKHALVIGRFQPLHRGHINLLKRYHKAKFNLKIGVGSPKKSRKRHHPLTLQEREIIIKKVLGEMGIKKYEIYKIPDIKSDEKYVSHVKKIVGKFDTIITGNKKVLKLFLEDKKENSFSIESFEESIGRPGGKVTSGTIRKLWRKGPSRKGITREEYKVLKKMEFTKILKESFSHH